jgi:hypothetical protein
MIERLKWRKNIRKGEEQGVKSSASMKTVYCLFLIGIFYITSAHFVEKRMRTIHSLKGELKELRWEYMSVKSNLMHSSTLSQVAEAVVDREGIKSTALPRRIVVN